MELSVGYKDENEVYWKYGWLSLDVRHRTRTDA
jgi:hypothetical protein